MTTQIFNLETLMLNMENFRGQTVFDRKKNGYFVDCFKSSKDILNFKKEESIIKATDRAISLLFTISISYERSMKSDRANDCNSILSKFQFNFQNNFWSSRLVPINNSKSADTTA